MNWAQPGHETRDGLLVLKNRARNIHDETLLQLGAAGKQDGDVNSSTNTRNCCLNDATERVVQLQDGAVAGTTRIAAHPDGGCRPAARDQQARPEARAKTRQHPEVSCGRKSRKEPCRRKKAAP